MSETIIKAELAERIDPAILKKYLNISDLGVGSTVKVYVEVMRIMQKLTRDGKPFISYVFKDIQGRVIYGSHFDQTLNTDTFRRIMTYKRIFAMVTAKVGLYLGRVNLTLDDIQIVDNADVSSELSDAFSPLFPEAESYYNKIMETEFGLYQPYAKILIDSNLFEPLKTMCIEDFGTAKRGEVTKVISDTFDILDKLSTDSSFAKLVFLVSFFIHLNTRPVGMVKDDLKVTKPITLLANLIHRLVAANAVSLGDPTFELLKDEIERMLLQLLDTNQQHSVTTLTIKIVLELQLETAKLRDLATSNQKGAPMMHRNLQVWNV